MGGSTFSVEFEAEPKDRIVRLPDFSARGRKSVLLIGGDHAKRALLREKLCSAGHDIVDIHDRRPDVVSIEQNPPDMMIIVTETVDGYAAASLASILRIRFPRIPVITLKNGNSVEGRGLVCISGKSGETRGEALLAASRSLLDMIRTIDQTRPPPRLLNQYL